MNLKKQLKSVKDQYEYELQQILEFAHTTEKSLTRKQKRKLNVKLEGEDQKELNRLIDFLRDISDGTSKNGQSISLKSEAIGQLVTKFVVPMKHKNFLNDMTLSYLISYMEAMLKDYLNSILVCRKSALKSNNKITYDEVLSFNSMKTIIAFLAQKEIDQLGYSSIDDVSKYFREKFNIDFSEYQGWKNIVEASLRRNLVIHNKGITNEYYCTRIGYKKLGEKIKIDFDYIISVTENLISFVDFCYQAFLIKFKLS